MLKILILVLLSSPFIPLQRGNELFAQEIGPKVNYVGVIADTSRFINSGSFDTSKVAYTNRANTFTGTTQTAPNFNATTAIKLNGTAYPAPENIPTLNGYPTFTAGLRADNLSGRNTVIGVGSIAVTGVLGSTTIAPDGISTTSTTMTASDNTGNLLWVRSITAGDPIVIGLISFTTYTITLSDGTTYNVLRGL